MFPPFLLKTLSVLCRFCFRATWVRHDGGAETRLTRGVYIANYASWADSILLAALLHAVFEAPVAVAVNLRHRNRFWAKLLGHMADVLYYDPVKADAECNALLADAIRSGRALVLQPEGRPTDTGALLPMCDTLAAIVAETDALLRPLFIAGSETSCFSAMRPRQCRMRLLPRVTVHVFPAARLGLPGEVKSKARTEQAAKRLYDLLSDAAFAHYNRRRTLFSALLDAASTHGGNHVIAEDSERGRISYRKLITGSYVLGAALNRRLKQGETMVGLMLPNANGALVTFCALQAYGKIPALLNFTAGRANMRAAAKTALLRTVITSKRFIKVAELEKTINAFREDGLHVLYLEDMRREIGLVAKLCGGAHALMGRKGYARLRRRLASVPDCDEPAVVLFTSGSEGTPKGVALSHANLLANIAQLRSRIDFGAADCLFNPLPMFHSSGLTGGCILPLLSGMKMFLYPSPLHYQTIPELIADSGATILFATDTFLNGYARYARPHDLHRLRYVFAGAEKLRDETRRLWAERFGVRIFEGYGVTETAPVLAFNTPIFAKPASVGRFAPAIRHRLEPVEFIAEGGRLWVQAPNVMSGYLLADEPGRLAMPQDGWHDTGDIVNVDAEGFVHILGRAKRFAKIGGEMVSLCAVEQRAAALWPDAAHAVVNFPDARKGEQLALVTTQKDASRETLLVFFRQEGLTELSVPRHVIPVDMLPVLGTGKTDYPAIHILLAMHLRKFSVPK